MEEAKRGPLLLSKGQVQRLVGRSTVTWPGGLGCPAAIAEGGVGLSLLLARARAVFPLLGLHHPDH